MIPRTSEHSIVAVPADGLAQTVHVRSHTLTTDQPARAGGDDAGPTPLELIGAGLASCIALYIHKYCVQQGLDDGKLAVEVKPLWRNDPGRIGRFDVILYIPDVIPAEYHEEIDLVARTCPVHHTLTHGPEITLRRISAEPLARAG